MLDVTTMNLSDDLVRTKCAIRLNGQTYVVDWRVKCAESGELRQRLKSLQFAFKRYERESAVKEDTSCRRIQEVPSHGMRSSSGSRQAKSML